jgi:hypothetical protein
LSIIENIKQFLGSWVVVARVEGDWGEGKGRERETDRETDSYGVEAKYFGQS